MAANFAGELSRNSKYFEQPAPRIPFLSNIAAQLFPTKYVKVFDAYRGQGTIDFVKAKADGYEVAILKASEGLAADSMFQTNWKKAIDAGMYVLTYHFFRGNINGIDQASFHLEIIEDFLNDISYKPIAFLDIETADGIQNSTRITRATDWWNTIKNYSSNLRAGTYTSKNYWQLLMSNITMPADVVGWVAAWTSANQPALPIGWTEAQTKFWQYGVYNTHSWALPVPGVTTKVDVDRWFGDLASLKLFLGGEVIPVPPTHSHPEIEKEIADLKDRVKVLESNFMLQLPKVWFVPTEESLAYRVKDFNAKDNELFDFYPTGSAEDVGKRIHIVAPIEVFHEPVYSGDGGFKAYCIADAELLAKNRPTCSIYVDATKGHLKVA